MSTDNTDAKDARKLWSGSVSATMRIREALTNNPALTNSVELHTLLVNLALPEQIQPATLGAWVCAQDTDAAAVRLTAILTDMADYMDQARKQQAARTDPELVSRAKGLFRDIGLSEAQTEASYAQLVEDVSEIVRKVRQRYRGSKPQDSAAESLFFTLMLDVSKGRQSSPDAKEDTAKGFTALLSKVTDAVGKAHAYEALLKQRLNTPLHEKLVEACRDAKNMLSNAQLQDWVDDIYGALLSRFDSKTFYLDDEEKQARAMEEHAHERKELEEEIKEELKTQHPDMDKEEITALVQENYSAIEINDLEPNLALEREEMQNALRDDLHEEFSGIGMASDKADAHAEAIAAFAMREQDALDAGLRDELNKRMLARAGIGGRP